MHKCHKFILVCKFLSAVTEQRVWQLLTLRNMGGILTCSLGWVLLQSWKLPADGCYAYSSLILPTGLPASPFLYLTQGTFARGVFVSVPHSLTVGTWTHTDNLHFEPYSVRSSMFFVAAVFIAWLNLTAFLYQNGHSFWTHWKFWMFYVAVC